MTYKLIEMTEAAYLALFSGYTPTSEPKCIQLCKADGNIIAIASATDPAALASLTQCTRDVAEEWADVEWQYSAPEIPGINPFASYGKTQGYNSPQAYAEALGL